MTHSMVMHEATARQHVPLLPDVTTAPPTKITQASNVYMDARPLLGHPRRPLLECPIGSNVARTFQNLPNRMFRSMQTIHRCFSLCVIRLRSRARIFALLIMLVIAFAAGMTRFRWLVRAPMSKPWVSFSISRNQHN